MGLIDHLTIERNRDNGTPWWIYLS